MTTTVCSSESAVRAKGRREAEGEADEVWPDGMLYIERCEGVSIVDVYALSGTM